MTYLFALIAGVFWVAWWPALPQLLPLAVILCLLTLLARFARRWLRLPPLAVLAFAVGTCYGVVAGQQRLAQQLPADLDKRDFIVTGTVTGIPETNAEQVRFYFKVKNITLLDAAGGVANAGGDPPLPVPARIRLSWFHSPQAISPQQIAPQQRWQFHVRLRRPRGTLNPGGFDYQLWLLRQGIAATGYVRSHPDNRPLNVQPSPSLHQLRYRISRAIDDLPAAPATQSLLAALTLGDRRQISSADWQAYASLGLVHLLVISGLHIGLAALLAYGLAVFLARLAALLFPGVTVHYWGAATAVLAAAGYASLAGWTIPTQRAFTMVAVAGMLVLLNRTRQKLLGFMLALLVVALLDPLAVWAAGFWLSFAAVAALLWLAPSRGAGRRAGLSAWIVYPLKVQLVISLGLIPLLLMLGLPFSPLMPLVNLVAIPWISFLVVPLCLAAGLLWPLAPLLANQLWMWAVPQLQWFVALARQVSDLGIAFDRAILPPGFWPVAALAAGMLLVLLPTGLRLRLPGVVLMLAPWLHNPDPPPLRVTVLDVGQGLAVVVETRRHRLVYDAGPFYSERFNAGTAIVAPYLSWRGIHRLDAVVISHSDNDHAGGALPLMTAVPTERLLVDPLLVERLGDLSQTAEVCREGVAWRWDGVDFRVLSPRPPYPENDNNRSCVLQIRLGEIKVLLPGDIEREAEQALLTRRTQLGLEENITLLVAPHHGSNTSSSRAFIEHLRPRHVVFSSGYRHHFGHPHQRVISRYRRVGSEPWNTAHSGALQFVWNRRGELKIFPERERVRRFWHW